MSRRTFGLAFVIALLWAGCESDKVLRARRVLSEDPRRAIALLTEALQEQNPCFDCNLYLGLAYEKTGEIAHAIEAYERALEDSESSRRPEPFVERLLWLYEQAFEAAKDVKEKEAIATKAAPLEAKLQVANPWANRYLFEKFQRAFRAATSSEEAISAANEAQKLYVEPEKKASFAKEVTEWQREAFGAKATRAIRERAQSELVQRGFLEGEELVIRNAFKIPSKREAKEFDPTSDNFTLLLRLKSCEPLRAKLDEVVSLVREAAGIREPTREELDLLFEKLFTYAKAGYARYGAEKNPAGEEYLCFIRLPLQAFVSELFRFSE